MADLNLDFLDYFAKHTDDRFDQVHQKFDEVHKKLDKLISFRWMLIGASIGVSGVVSFLFEVVKAFARVHQ